MPPGNPAGYLPPEIQQDAIARLLVEKYQVPPDQVPAMREAILAGKATGSDSLMKQAGKRVADMALAKNKELLYLTKLSEFKGKLDTLPEKERAKAIKENPDLLREYEEFIESGRQSVRDEAAQHKEREDEALREKYIYPELERIDNITEWMQDVKPVGNQGAYSTGYRPLGEGTGLIPLQNRAVVFPTNSNPQPQPAPTPSAPQESAPVSPPNLLMGEGGKIAPEDVYRARLQRALTARKALLGQ